MLERLTLNSGAAMTSERDLSKGYEKAGFGGVPPFGKRPALLIIDVVMAYLDAHSPLYAGVEDALAANERSWPLLERPAIR